MRVLPGNAFPIPAPPGTPAWVNVLFALAAVTTVVVLIWQAVRYFRQHPSNDDDGDDRHDNGDSDAR